MIRAKFGAYRTNRFEDIQILLNFGFSSAAILDFEKRRFWHFRCLEVSRRSSMANLVKIGLTVHELFKFRPSCFSNFPISGYGPIAGVTMIACIKFGPGRFNGSKVIKIFLSHWKCITGTPKRGFLWVLGVKT